MIVAHDKFVAVSKKKDVSSYVTSFAFFSGTVKHLSRFALMFNTSLLELIYDTS